MKSSYDKENSGGSGGGGGGGGRRRERKGTVNLARASEQLFSTLPRATQGVHCETQFEVKGNF